MARDPQPKENHKAKTPPQPNRDQQNINIDDPEQLAKMFMEAANRLWAYVKRISDYLMIELGGYSAFDKAARWCARHPYMAICLIAAACTILPCVLLIGGIVLSTIALTFTGFLFVEGTLLTIISIVLFACLGGLAIVLLVFAVIFVAGYFGFSHIYDLYGGHRKSALLNFLRNEQTLVSNDQTAPEAAHTS